MRELGQARDVVKHRPEALHRGHRVHLLQVCLVLGCRGPFSSPGNIILSDAIGRRERAEKTYLCIQNVQDVCSGTPTLSLLVKAVMVVGLMLLGEKASCSGAASRCATEGWAAIGMEVGALIWNIGTSIHTVHTGAQQATITVET